MLSFLFPLWFWQAFWSAGFYAAATWKIYAYIKRKNGGKPIKHAWFGSLTIPSSSFRAKNTQKFLEWADEEGMGLKRNFSFFSWERKEKRKESSRDKERIVTKQLPTSTFDPRQKRKRKERPSSFSSWEGEKKKGLPTKRIFSALRMERKKSNPPSSALEEE